jgi:ABC-type Fe3+-hydroxamate transport system substrate-binding protein
VLVVAIYALNEQGKHTSHGGTSSGSSSPTSSPANGAQSGRTATASTSKPSTSTAPTSTAASSSPTTRADTASSPTTADLHSQSIVVLNNTETQGLAKSAQQRFEAGGWNVTQAANYQNDILSTCAYYDPSSALAKDAAEALQRQYPTIKRVEPQFSGLESYDSPIVVILTPDYSPN